jgi:predicted transcriptional regulator
MGKVETSVIDILQKGEIFQSDLVRQTGSSKSRVSEVLSSLELRGLISRSSLGKNSRIVPSSKLVRSSDRQRKKKVLSLGMIRASEYPFIIPFEKLLREKSEIILRPVIYENGLDIARDLFQLRLDLGIAPVLTHFVFYSTGSPIKMIAPAGSGGSTIIARRSRLSSSKNFKVATTKLSTMELLVRSSMNLGEIPQDCQIHYHQGPKTIVNALISGESDAASIWEPYATILQKRKGDFKKIHAESKEDVCCALAAGNHLDSRTIGMVAKSFVESLELYRKNPEDYSSSYSTFMNFDQKIGRIVSRMYRYPLELDHQKLASQFERAGVKIPLPSSVKDAIWRGN